VDWAEQRHLPRRRFRGHVEWAKKNGLDVPARGRLRPEIWDQYRVAHLT
jgi:hypothetical protein